VTTSPGSHLGRHLLIGAVLVIAAPLAAVGAVAVGAAGLPAAAAASDAAARDIPPALLPLYQQAAATCPGLPWPVLAGVGKVESDHNRPPRQTSSAGAQGPMQFLPATWDQYGADANADGQSDPFDPADAIAAAGRYLCGHGAARDLGGAVASYLCGDLPACQTRAQQPGGYAARVLDWAARYTDPTGPAGPAATRAVQVALAQVGTPYVWGGETPGLGFDCSGLVQHAYAAGGIPLPRTAQAQHDADPLLPAGSTPQPGDLVFFGANPDRITHVGIALGQGRMVDAPHTGALVRVEPIAGFGPLRGISRPAATASGPST
jgi:cell wall-associated NlpC family hydrolase